MQLTGWSTRTSETELPLEKYLVLTAQGNLLVCRDADSPPNQVVSLSKDCLLIAEGREILDLPRLPPGGRRECCLALILTQDKFLLLLAENANDCRLTLETRQFTSPPPDGSTSPSFDLGCSFQWAILEKTA
uniref:Uncharacterized protein n=1 Tax=Paramormyrops kingsleyae TaxID=1676925 RepID=A0A3B3SNV2_9TELE